jgi:phage/plasmid-like protein (TIGR03299 family)
MTAATPVLDRNAAFTAERTRQIESIRSAPERAEAKYAADKARFEARVATGELRDLGNGRFEATDGFDKGEIWTLRKTQFGDLVMPEHNLDESTGSAALYTRVPAWHALGNMIPDGVTDIGTVLQLGGIDFEVASRPVLYQTELNGLMHVLPDFFVNTRSDTNAGLGVVGKVYEPIQNREAFEFLTELVGAEDGTITWESAGALYGGRRVFVCMRLPEEIRVDVDGINDMIVPYIAAINSHDGSSEFEVVVTPWRIECGNTERFALRDAKSRWGVRHTTNALAHVQEARRTLALSHRYYESFTAEMNDLARTAITTDQFIAMCEQLWTPPEADATVRIKNNHKRRQDRVVNVFEDNAAALGRTAYAAERAITEFTDWKRDIRPRGDLRGKDLAARATAALLGTEDEIKSGAHRHLRTLVRR